MEQSFIAYIENSIKNNWDLDDLTEQFPLGSHLSCYFDLRRSNCPHLT